MAVHLSPTRSTVCVGPACPLACDLSRPDERMHRMQDASMTMTMISHLVCCECIYHALRSCDLTRMMIASRIFTTPV